MGLRPRRRLVDKAITAFVMSARLIRSGVVGVSLLAVLSGCGGDGTGAPLVSTPSATPSSTPTATTTPFPDSTEPVAVEAGTYRIPSSAWSVADFSVALPEGWTVQYGHVYAKHPDTDEELGFYPVVVDAIYADACAGESGDLTEVGPTVADLAAALLEQPGPKAAGPVETTLGGHPATRIDLSVPKGFDLKACSLGGIGLQIWYSRPADKYFVLLPKGIASVYIVDVDGERQVFLTFYTPASPDEDVRELQAVLDSIRIET
jgi:hypothetical protein